MIASFSHIAQIIHETPHRGVIAITGGGTESIGELLRHGNGSKTLLEAVVPYDQEAFRRFIGGTPDKYCSEKAACQLAIAAYQRARSLVGNDEKPLFGIGATCSLAKDNEREGRLHHIYVAVQKPNEIISYSAEFPQGHSRKDEETAASIALLNGILDACDLERHWYPLTEWVILPPTLQRKVAAANETKDLFHDKCLFSSLALQNTTTNPTIIFPGSFNPLHDGHLAVIKAAHEFTGQNISLEISIRNVDKPMLDYFDIAARTQQIKESIKDLPYVTNLIFTNAPLFIDKAILFPNTTFIVGADTLERICNDKYYECPYNIVSNGDIALGVMGICAHHQVKYLVFPCIQDGTTIGLESLQNNFLVNAQKSRITEIPPNLFTPTSASSKEIRRTAT